MDTIEHAQIPGMHAVQMLIGREGIPRRSTTLQRWVVLPKSNVTGGGASSKTRLRDKVAIDNVLKRVPENLCWSH